MSRVRWALVLSAALSSAARPLPAAVRQTVDASASAVQAAVNAASNGDTIRVAAGQSTWTTTVTVPNSKRLTLQGAGVGSTVITSSNRIVLNLGRSGSRVTGFEFINSTIEVDGDDWRIDHNKSTADSGFFDFVRVRGNRETIHPRGVVDHNAFHNSRVVLISWTGLDAHALWAQPTQLGSAQRVFIEDNVFTASQHSNVVDGNYGSRYVFRHNAVTDSYIESHSLQQGRAARSWEIYDNTIRQSRRGMWTPYFIRGATGVIFNNTLTGTWGSPTITLDNVRCKEPRDYGQCNGSSTADGNQLSNGWPGRDQIGRGADTGLSNPSSTSASATGWFPQASEPAYFWNNTNNGAPVNVYVHNNCGPWIQAGRDFHNNTPKPGYAPYTYPHPLTQGGAVPALPAVTVNATDASAGEASNPGTFTIARTGSTASALAVTFAVGGTAAGGGDFVALGNSVTIPAGAASAAVTVTPVNDSAVEGNETVILTISAHTAYTVGSPASATVTIADDDGVPPPPPPPTPPGRMGHWNLDEGTGTTAADSSGKGNTGTLVNGPVWVNGFKGKALSFDKLDDGVTCGSGSTLDNLPALTVAAWINPRNLGENSRGRIVDKALSVSPVQGWCFLLTHSGGANGLQFIADYDTANLSRRSVANTVGLNQWQHVAVTWSGSASASNVHLYSNGEEVAYDLTVNGIGSRLDDAAQALRIGNSRDGSRTFDGMLDDVQVYNRVLSVSEIAALAAGAPVLVPSTETSEAPSTFTEEDGAEDLLGDALLPDDSEGASCGATGAEVVVILGLFPLLRRPRKRR